MACAAASVHSVEEALAILAKYGAGEKKAKKHKKKEKEKEKKTKHGKKHKKHKS